MHVTHVPSLPEETFDSDPNRRAAGQPCDDLGQLTIENPGTAGRGLFSGLQIRLYTKLEHGRTRKFEGGLTFEFSCNIK